MSKTTFGELLGQLIYTKRKILGLTQIQLAEDAYGSAGKTRRISELESGKVANPHPKTIDPIIVTLGITEEELANCAAESNVKPDPALELAYSEAQTLIDELAAQFEYRNKNASLSDLEEFLIAKARELAELKEKLGDIEVPEDQVSDLKEAAVNALFEGEYAKVDQLLKEAEHIQQETQTLSQIGKQAELRILRGDTHFFSGNLADCFEMYKGAALYYEPFDQDIMATVLQDCAKLIYESGRRSIEPTYWVAQKLLEEAVSRYTSNKNPKMLGGIHYRLALILRNQSANSERADAEVFLDDAIEHARKSVTILSNTGDMWALASAQISLGNCLSDGSRLKRDATMGEQAVGVFEEARKTISNDGTLIDLLGHACNGLGAALLRTATASSTTEDHKKASTRAIAAYEEAVAASSRVFDPEIWGTAQINLGNLLADASRSQGISEEEASFLRIRSISNFQAAIETYPEVQFPMAFAEAHSGLAEVLFEHGLNANEQLFELYFVRAISSFSQVLEFYSEDTSPSRWAYLQCRLGSIFGNHAVRVSGETAEHDLEMAISHFDAGREVYKKLGETELEETCVRNLAALKEQQDKLE
ncbi:MAG: tetratricopeptide (TPR) repeat protein [Yoonia sp.]|jgi:tetratricopeptide (TPR) repeat protein